MTLLGRVCRRGEVVLDVAFLDIPFGRCDLHDNPVDLDRADEGKTRLDSLSKIVGVQAQLFSETVRGPQWGRVLYLPQDSRSGRARVECASALGELTGRGRAASLLPRCVSFLPAVGYAGISLPDSFRGKCAVASRRVCVIDGRLYANSPLSSAVIRYTTDGSEPGTQSTVVAGPGSLSCGLCGQGSAVLFRKRECNNCFVPDRL